jgi:hypothetical protein
MENPEANKKANSHLLLKTAPLVAASAVTSSLYDIR